MVGWDNQTVTLPANTTVQQFTVTDTCGSWPSFVGGGVGAGF